MSSFDPQYISNRVTILKKGVGYSDTPVTGCDMYNKQGLLMIINATNCKCTESTVIIHGLDTISIAQ